MRLKGVRGSSFLSWLWVSDPNMWVTPKVSVPLQEQAELDVQEIH